MICYTVSVTQNEKLAFFTMKIKQNSYYEMSQVSADDLLNYKSLKGYGLARIVSNECEVKICMYQLLLL